MTKRERETLRECVGAVCQFSEPQGGFDAASVPGRVAGRERAEEWRHDTGTRLNAADDRLRALGMLA